MSVQAEKGQCGALQLCAHRLRTYACLNVSSDRHAGHWYLSMRVSGQRAHKARVDVHALGLSRRGVREGHEGERNELLQA